MSRFFFSVAGAVVTVVVAFVLATPSTATAAQPPASYSIPNPPNERLKDFTIVEDQGTWHVFAMSVCLAAPCTRPWSVIWHYVSRDLSTWTNLGIVLAPRAGLMDQGDVWAPSVVHINNEWLMYYTAVVYQNAMPVQRIAVATSTDLYTWNRSTNNVVLDCSTLSWAYWNLNDTGGIGGDCRDPYVRWDTDHQRWSMTVSTRTTGQWGEHQMVIGHVWSDDGIVWHEGGVFLMTKGWTAESSHSFQYQGRTYLLWTKCAAGQTCIQWADSSALTETFSAPHNLAGSETWNYASEVIMFGDQPLLLYVGYGITERRLQFTGETPTSIPLGLPTVSLHPRLQIPDVAADQFPGLAGVSFLVYRQTTSTWDPEQDPFVSSFETNTSTFGIAPVPPGAYWIVPDPDEFLPGATLDHFAPMQYVQPMEVDWEQAQTSTWDVTLAGRRWNLGSVETSIDHSTIPATTSSNLATPFSQLQSIALVGAGLSNVGIILSNDDGQTWWTVEQGDWVQTEAVAANAASISMVNQAAPSFPAGSGLLRWSLFLPTEAVAITVDVGLDTPASTPQLLMPQDGSSVESVRPTFSFSVSDQEGEMLSYILQYCTTSCQSVESYSMPTGWSGMPQGFGSSGQTVQWTPTAALGNGLLQWRVRSADRNGSGQWSEWSMWSEVTLPNPATITASATILTTSSAHISWRTNNFSTIYIYYVDEVDHEYTTHQAKVEDAVDLTDFLPGYSYDLEVRATDIYGQDVTTYLHLEMPSMPTIVAHLSAQWDTDGLRVQWETNGPATGQVRYGAVNDLSHIVSSTSTGTSHSVFLPALAEGQVVHYQISGQGGTSYSSAILTFTTPVTTVEVELEHPADPLPILRPGRIIRPRR